MADSDILTVPESARSAVQQEAEKTFTMIGLQIRTIRQRRRMTIQQLADASGMSASMLSLVERGLTSPSLLTLTAIGRNLGITLAEMMSGEAGSDESITRAGDIRSISTNAGILRRVLRQDPKRGVTITYSEYAPGSSNSASGITHSGFEYGVVLDGDLSIELDGVTEVLRKGDVVSFKSTRVHKIWNNGPAEVTTMWFNLDDRDG